MDVNTRLHPVLLDTGASLSLTTLNSSHCAPLHSPISVNGLEGQTLLHQSTPLTFTIGDNAITFSVCYLPTLNQHLLLGNDLLRTHFHPQIDYREEKVLIHDTTFPFYTSRSRAEQALILRTELPAYIPETTPPLPIRVTVKASTLLHATRETHIPIIFNQKAAQQFPPPAIFQYDERFQAQHNIIATDLLLDPAGFGSVTVSSFNPRSRTIRHGTLVGYLFPSHDVYQLTVRQDQPADMPSRPHEMTSAQLKQLHINPALTHAQRVELVSLVRLYADIFAWHRHEHHRYTGPIPPDLTLIQLTHQTPIYSRPYRYAPKEQECGCH